MADKNTSSIGFPNMFDIVRNRVNVYTGNRSIVNRTRLLILTNPTELYNNPTLGVGLKRYLWQYNTKNVQAIIQDKIVAQLREHEPCVEADKTQFHDGLLITGSDDEENISKRLNELKLTVGLQTVYSDQLDVNINLSEEQANMFGGEV